jgi:hypothetical protein
VDLKHDIYHLQASYIANEHLRAVTPYGLRDILKGKVENRAGRSLELNEKVIEGRTCAVEPAEVDGSGHLG